MKIHFYKLTNSPNYHDTNSHSHSKANGEKRKRYLKYTQETQTEECSSFSGHAVRSNFHRSGNNKGSFRGIDFCKLIVHEPTLHNGFIPRHYFVTIAALKSLLVLVTMMSAVLHLLKVPYDAELPDCRHQMFFLFTTFSNLVI